MSTIAEALVEEFSAHHLNPGSERYVGYLPFYAVARRRLFRSNLLFVLDRVGEVLNEAEKAEFRKVVVVAHRDLSGRILHAKTVPVLRALLTELAV